MSIWKDVEGVCEDFRTRLVELLGDHAGVHNAVSDARASLALHIPADALQEKQAADAAKVDAPAETETPKEV